MSDATLQVLMPMGGLGSRFAKAGYETPKALIEVDGKPMFMRALDSFEGIDNIQHIFVIRQEHVEQYDLENKIRAHLPNAKISILDHDTGGAVETCMIANEHIADDIPITLADCDGFFESKLYFEKIEKIRQTGEPDGLIVTFTSTDPRYSFVKLNDEGKAIATAEKVAISDHAVFGGYMFRTGKLFKELAGEFISNPLPEGLKEYYVSHLFNMLLERGGSFEIADAEKMHIWGTPEELDTYNASRAAV